MTTSLRIAIADDEPEMQEFLEMALEQLGHEVVVQASNGKELVKQCREMQPDLVITDIRMPDMDGLQAVAQLRTSQPVPVILVSGYSDPEYVEAALQNHVLAYLIKPIKSAHLHPAISLVMQRYKEFEALQRQTDDLRQALNDRKVIERAKGILMTRTGLSESDAFKRLQLLSSQKNTKLAQIAEMIVTAEEAMA